MKSGLLLPCIMTSLVLLLAAMSIGCRGTGRGVGRAINIAEPPQTLAAAQVVMPTPAPGRTWPATGDWFADSTIEADLRAISEAQGAVPQDIRAAGLDSLEPGGFYLLFACPPFGEFVQVNPYEQPFPAWVNSLSAGVWDASSDRWMSPTDVATFIRTSDIRYGINLPDSRSAINAGPNPARRMFNLLRKAGDEHLVFAVMLASQEDAPNNKRQMTAIFDPAGIENAATYLPCY